MTYSTPLSTSIDVQVLHRFFDEKITGVCKSTNDAAPPYFVSAPFCCEFSVFRTLVISHCHPQDSRQALCYTVHTRHAHEWHDYHRTMHRTSLLKHTLRIAGPFLWNSLTVISNYRFVYAVLETGWKRHCYVIWFNFVHYIVILCYVSLYHVIHIIHCTPIFSISK